MNKKENEYYKELLEKFLSETEFQIENFNHFVSKCLKSDFDNQFHSSLNKHEVLENEYKYLNGIIEEYRIRGINNSKLVLSSYNSKYSNDIEIDEFKKNEPNELFLIDFGKGLAVHHIYLDSIKKELKSTNTKENVYQFLIKEQLLILDYLGVLKAIKGKNTFENQAFFLAGLLNRSPKEIKTMLGKIENIKSPSSKDIKAKETLKLSLNEIKKAFESLKNDSIVEKINRNIKELD